MSYADSIINEYYRKNCNAENYYISRIDVTLDSETEFEKCYKVNSFIINLDSTRLNVDNTFCTTHKSGAKRQYPLKGSNYQHAFYDKKAESKGRDDACSRTEIRYLRQHRTIFVRCCLKKYEEMLQSYDRRKSLIEKYRCITDLTKPIVDEFIDTIYIGEINDNNEREITINWRI